MAEGALGTTNALLATLVVISVLHAIALAVVVVGAIRLYTQMLATVRDVQQELRPLVERASALATTVERIAADVETTTARAAAGAATAGAAFQAAINVATLVRGTAGRSVIARVLPVLGLARGLRVAYRTFVGSRKDPPPRRSSRSRDDRDGQRHRESTVHPSMTGNQNTEAIHGT